LFEVALALNAALRLRLEPRSKAERGYALFTGAQAAPRKAAVPEVEADMSVSSAFVTIVHSCLAHLQANELGVLSDDDIEYVHQMRVALRRLRSAISVFGAVIPQQTSADIVAQLRWLASELNDARNWDVFVAQTLPPIMQAQGDHAGLAWLQSRALDAQSASRRRARAAVASSRYQALLLELGAWLAAQAWSTHAVPQALATPVGEFAAQVLEQRHKRLRKRGKHLVRLTAAERHALRIAAKRLRYCAEFFANLFAKSDVQDYVEALANLQDVLGNLNDAATTATLLDAPALKSDNALEQRALGLIQGWVNGRSSVEILSLESIWRVYKKTARFW
jgi:CHAD domain-containing protein